jgi:hypothetical protein
MGIALSRPRAQRSSLSTSSMAGSRQALVRHRQHGDRRRRGARERSRAHAARRARPPVATRVRLGRARARHPRSSEGQRSPHRHLRRARLANEHVPAPGSPAGASRSFCSRAVAARFASAKDGVHPVALAGRTSKVWTWCSRASASSPESVPSALVGAHGNQQSQAFGMIAGAPATHRERRAHAGSLALFHVPATPFVWAPHRATEQARRLRALARAPV